MRIGCLQIIIWSMHAMHALDRYHWIILYLVSDPSTTNSGISYTLHAGFVASLCCRLAARWCADAYIYMPSVMYVNMQINMFELTEFNNFVCFRILQEFLQITLAKSYLASYIFS